MITNLSEEQSIVSTWLAELRDKDIQQDTWRFRNNIRRIGAAIAVEISKTLEYKDVTVKTPLGDASTQQLVDQPVLATILRAGLPMHEGVLEIFDRASCAFLAEYRKHDEDGTFVDIEAGYITSPEIDGKVVIIADPMLATGSSLIRAVEMIKAVGTPKKIHIAAVIAASDGVEALKEKLPDVDIWCGAIDPELTDAKYIYPGLGDAGDLSYGEKVQK
ncbi:MAG TPA: uracil phosphoribosyltransferase [Candidatus Saccharimonadales bacterium]